ncbi:MAG: hypothetical protein WC542_00020 [Paludibacter sp.]|jgi:hypothetical protein
MEVITIESNAFKELEAKINLIAKLLIEQQLYTNEYCNDRDVNNYDVCSLLKINESTLRRLRSKGL